MMINKCITKVNRTVGNNRQIKYLVKHYVGALGGAKQNCDYFKSVNRGASAHYFVGHDGEIWQSVEDKDIAWHCGKKGTYKHPNCRNSNSIGIELCVKKDSKGEWYYTEATKKAAVELFKYLMKKYNIPVSNVLRHSDVVGADYKVCPYTDVKYPETWKKFLQELGGGTSSGGSTASGKVTIIYKGAEGVNYRSKPDYEKTSIVGQAKYGEVFTVVGQSGEFYKLKSGYYITKNIQYVKYEKVY